MVRDVGVAEELAQDALVAALERWPKRCSENPGAWLMAAAKNRAIDHLRRSKLPSASMQELGYAGSRANGRPEFETTRRTIPWATTCCA